MSVFNILHLSDTHLGNKKRRIDSNEVFNPLFADLNSHKDTKWKPNLIIFTGDLAWGETETGELKKQYDLALIWLNRIYKELDTDSTQVPILFVPGNHDINRRSVDRFQQSFIDGLKEIDGESKIEPVLDPTSQEWNSLIKRQDEWWAFVRSFANPGWEWDDQFRICHRIFKVNGETIGVVGINTSWACSRDGEKNFLWVGQNQAQAAWQKIESCNMKICASHHPPECMHAADHYWTTEKIESKFNIFFHGHEHSQWFRDSENHLRIAAGPCYDGSTKPNAYSWLRLDFLNKQSFIRLRKYEQRGKGGWVPFILPDKTDDNGEKSIVGLFRSHENELARVGSDVIGEPTANPIARPTQAAALRMPTRVEEFIERIQDSFGYTWEPSDFCKSSKPIIVFWPVRLRQPTPIHAVQAFTASGFLRYGAKVILCLDDLGNAETTRRILERRVKKWIKRTSASADLDRFDVRSMKYIKSRTREDLWKRINEWLANQTQYNLLGILEVSKLLPTQGHSALISELANKRSRRLLTPALVWTSLHHFIIQNRNCRFITLGGHDERILWKAWRECISDSALKVGHLYVPELKGYEEGFGVRSMSMQSGTLAWDSLADIEAALNKELKATSPESFISEGRMAHWCYTKCLAFPSFLLERSSSFNVDGKNITSWTDLIALPTDKIPHVLSDAIRRWLL